MGRNLTYDNTIETNACAMYLSCLAGTTMAHPMEVLRLNVQANALDYFSLPKIMMIMFRQKGLHGFFFGYRGAVTRVTVQTLSQYAIFNHLINSNYLLKFQSFNTYTIAALSGLGAGLISTPFAKLALIRQTDLTRSAYKKRNYTPSILRSFKCMYQKGGIPFLFAGYQLHTFHTCAMSVLYLPIYDKLEDILVDLHPLQKRTWEIRVYSIMLTESILSLILTPIDAIRTMVMNADHEQFTSKRHAYKKLLEVHGYRGFFFGLIPAMVAIIPHSIATITYFYFVDYNKT